MTQDAQSPPAQLARRYLLLAALVALLAFELAAEIRTTAWLAGAPGAGTALAPSGVAFTLGGELPSLAGASPWLRYGPYLLPPLLMLVVGAWIGLVRARDRIAFQVSLLLLVLAVSQSIFVERAPTLSLWPLRAVTASIVVARLAIYPLALLVVQVLAFFPSSSPAGRWILARRWLLLPYAVLSVESALEAIGRLYGTTLLPAAFTGALDRIVPWKYLWLALLAIAAVLIVTQRVATRGRQEARLGIVQAGLAGTILGGFCILFLWDNARFWSLVGAAGSGVLSGILRTLALFIPVLLLSSLPLSLGHSVLARRVFGIRVMVRRGIRYALLSRGVLVLEGLALFVILVGAVRLSERGEIGAVPALVVAGIMAVLVIFVVLRINGPLMRAIDRRFFRERYNARGLLLELGQEMLTLRESSDVLRRAGSVLLETLHARRVGFFLRDQAPGVMSLVWQAPGGPRGGSPSAAVGEGLDALEEGSRVWDIPVWRSAGPASSEALPAETEVAPFELLVALRASAGLLGCIALAGKRSDEPFTSEDKELLVTVATQMGFALENAALLEVAKKEAEQARELAIARGVQEGLFPSVLPQPAGWDFAAICRPARVVGGDYYDLFPPDASHVFLALGDVSGKGMGPALVMSGVQALIRNRAGRPDQDLTDLVGELNQHVLRSSSPETFVTLFVGVLDVESGALRYVNAGHNPPVLVRGSGPMRRLDEGGTPIGMFDRPTYAEGRALLDPGSLLVLYSDGVTEARDRAEGFYGEERLLDVILTSRTLSAAEALGRVLDSVGEFVRGAEAADDLSLVVARRLTGVAGSGTASDL